MLLRRDSMTQTKKEKLSQLEEKIEEYFLYCDACNEGKKDIVKPYTLSGLLCFTGLTRQEFLRLSKIKRHHSLFKRAEARIEAFIEENMLTGALSCNASLNSLKYNFGWGEKEEGGDEKSNEHRITVTLSPDMSELSR